MSVRIESLACTEGKIGQITLDAPQALNALSSAMINEIHKALDEWSEDPSICVVLLRGEGHRAFCAGGDIRALYEAMQDGADRSVAVDFFAREYRLNYALHRFPKPVIALAQGAVMGGGMGLFAASRYRLVTDNLILAMPEITIGLFPDVGASWFLNRLPGRLGLFMGLTGARLNVSDVLRVGLADTALQQEQADQLTERLQAERWCGEAAADDNRLFRLIKQIEHPNYFSLPASELEKHEQAIARYSVGDTLPDVVDSLLAANLDSPWWQRSIEALKQGCPVSAWLVWTQLRKAQQMSLKEIFRMEFGVAKRCVERDDFREGIRALLIDRDGSPNWSYPSVNDVPAEVVESHFRELPADQQLFREGL